MDHYYYLLFRSLNFSRVQQFGVGGLFNIVST